jgi:uncharacterized membrane protein YedE/YeeE
MADPSTIKDSILAGASGAGVLERNPVPSVLPPLFGGVLIGLAASLLWLGSRRIAGVSGIMAAAISPSEGRRAERLAFLVGLVLAGFALGWAEPPEVTETGVAPIAVVALAGVLAGFGARLGSGCTSGHGVCGMSRLSPRSLVATLTFIATGALTVFVVGRFLPALGVVR